MLKIISPLFLGAFLVITCLLLASQQTKTGSPKASLLAKGFHLVIGCLHFLTAIFWFGTILYVHLVLKPAYAASGLPRDEMKVGIYLVMVTSAVIVITVIGPRLKTQKNTGTHRHKRRVNPEGIGFM